MNDLNHHLHGCRTFYHISYCLTCFWALLWKYGWSMRKESIACCIPGVSYTFNAPLPCLSNQLHVFLCIRRFEFIMWFTTTCRESRIFRHGPISCRMFLMLQFSFLSLEKRDISTYFLCLLYQLALHRKHLHKKGPTSTICTVWMFELQPALFIYCYTVKHIVSVQSKKSQVIIGVKHSV